MSTSELCRSCGTPLVNRRANVRFCSPAHKQAFHRRKVDPLVGSPDRKRIRLDAYRELVEEKSLREEMIEAGLMPDGDHENHAPPSRRRGYYESQMPSEDDLFNPVYAAMKDAHDLYQGLVVTEKVQIQDNYREWLRSGKKEQPPLGSVVTREKQLRVSIGELSKIDIDRPTAPMQSLTSSEEPPMTKEVLDRLDRIEEKADRILVRLGDDTAIAETVDQFIDSVSECGVRVFAKP